MNKYIIGFAFVVIFCLLFLAIALTFQQQQLCNEVNKKIDNLGCFAFFNGTTFGHGFIYNVTNATSIIPRPAG